MYYLYAVAVILYTSSFQKVVAQYQPQTSDCTTTNGAPGICIPIRQCTPIVNVLQSRPLTPQTIQLLRQLQCGFEGQDPRVCCTFAPVVQPTQPPFQPSTFPPTEEKNRFQTESELINNLLDSPLLPSECGKELKIRIVGGKRTALDEFPWMALLEYQKPNGRSTACGGVLINKRYVLTAAHCLKGKDLPSTWRLTSVRLGEYDTDSDHDCIQDENESICADDPITVGIEEQYVHEQYRPLSRDQKYDIALLRLSRDVASTNFIKPICLPRNPSFGEKMYVAGWGKTENTSYSNVKLKLSLPLSNTEECQRIYGQVGVNLGFGQVCAGGQKDKDSCRGDSGGPLMSIERYPDGGAKWNAVGVVSFGPSPCGMQGWPGVYTKVYDYIPWIMSKLRA